MAGVFCVWGEGVCVCVCVCVWGGGGAVKGEVEDSERNHLTRLRWDKNEEIATDSVAVCT